MSIQPAIPQTDRTGSVARVVADAEEIAASRERVRSGLLGRERTVTLVLAAALIGTAIACAILIPSATPFSLWITALAVAAYAAVSQVEFEIGPGSAVPTELVLVPMLFVLPTGSVPLCVAGGLVLGGLVERVRSRRHGERIAVLLCSSWHSVGPTVVIGLFAPGPPEWRHLPVYAAALGAQIALDVAAVVVRHRIGRELPAVALVAPLGLVALVDAALAPVALVIAFAASAESAAMLCALPLAGLLHLLGTERKRKIDENIRLGRAVRDASRAARSDPLTGVGNRLAWQEALASAATSFERGSTGASVVLVDLNGLKETNDTFGHDAGDRLIQALAFALQTAIPSEAVLARIGGDEFAVLVSGADETRCRAIVRRIHREFGGLSVGRARVGASIGAASCPPCTSLDHALSVADQRLYAGKAGYRSLNGST